MDYIVGVAESKDIYTGLIPAWDNHFKAHLINPSNARAYARFLERRYGARPNIIWVLEDDHEPTGRKDMFREMAAGLKEVDAGRHLMTFYPRGWRSYSEWFHCDAWRRLRLHLRRQWQSLHCQPVQNHEGYRGSVVV